MSSLEALVRCHEALAPSGGSGGPPPRSSCSSWPTFPSSSSAAAISPRGATAAALLLLLVAHFSTGRNRRGLDEELGTCSYDETQVLWKLDFKFPLVVSCVHFICSSIGAYVAIHVLKAKPLIQANCEGLFNPRTIHAIRMVLLFSCFAAICLDPELLELHPCLQNGRRAIISVVDLTTDSSEKGLKVLNLLMHMDMMTL
ncbi:hypothetical protein ZWY2020_002840 [Hordeum vulgare]|nr:hypothetical protein ZWY2020_002840 [Hordeum vulgare]